MKPLQIENYLPKPKRKADLTKVELFCRKHNIRCDHFPNIGGIEMWQARGPNMESMRSQFSQKDAIWRLASRYNLEGWAEALAVWE